MSSKPNKQKPVIKAPVAAAKPVVKKAASAGRKWVITDPVPHMKWEKKGFYIPGIDEIKKEGRWHFIGACVVLFFGLMVLAKYTGINADDRYHVPYTKFFADYFTSGGKDTMYRQIPLDEFWKARVMFDMVNYTIAHGILGYSSGNAAKVGTKFVKWEFADPEYHEIRHYLIAIVAFIGILFSGLIAVRLRSWHFGILVMFLMALSPTFIGHCAMNPRDIPFFAWSLVAIYFMFEYAQDFPVIRWRTIIGIAIGVALALNVRNGGFLIFAYFGLFAGCLFLYHTFYLKDERVKLPKLVLQGFVAFIGAYVLGLAFWPYGQTDPVHIPIFVDLLSSQKYPITLRQLFEGKLINSGDLPWYYQTKLLFITAPLGIIAGFAAFWVLLIKYYKKVDWKTMLMVLFCAFFPILYIIKVDANVHTGWRHVIFCYPFIIMLTAYGWMYIKDLIDNRMFKIGVLALMTLSMMEPALYMSRNLSHCYVYFNQLVGGDKGAFGDYEFDYWSFSLTEGGKWLKENVIDKSNKPVMVTSNMWDSFGPYLKKDIKSGKVIYNGTKIYKRCQENWDYALYYAAFLDPVLLKNEHFWPLPGTIKTITADGAPIGIVVKRDPNKYDYKGFQALDSNKYELALDYFNKYVAIDPYNDEVYRGRAMAHLNLNHIDAGLKDMNAVLDINPTDLSTIEQLGNIYMNLHQFDKATAMFQREVDQGDISSVINGYQNMSKAYQAAGDMNNANICMQKAQDAYNAYQAANPEPAK